MKKRYVFLAFLVGLGAAFYQPAIDKYDQYIAEKEQKTQSNDFVVKKSQGLEYALIGDSESALKEFIQADKIQVSPEVKYWIGKTYIDLKKLNQARPYFEEVLKLYVLEKYEIKNFIYSRTHYYLGTIFFDEHDYRNALNHYQVALNHFQEESDKKILGALIFITRILVNTDFMINEMEKKIRRLGKYTDV